MLFNSYIFIGFLLAVIGVYYSLSRVFRGQNLFLLVASYAFYSAWDWRFLSLILICTGSNFYLARGIQRSATPGKRKLFLTTSILLNFGILGFFKYFNFFIETARDTCQTIGIQLDWPTLNIILPVGISFFTFQTMSYVVDVYRKKFAASNSIIDFALYVSFFPQLIAGPIERPIQLLRQISKKRPIDRSNLEEGLHHLVIGLFKKVVIADNMAPIVDQIFSADTSTLSAPLIWAGLLAFAFQIYGDFSGYSSMAQGIAKLMGFNLSYNFKMPYFATSPSDFWRRWHITLSEWLRDYLYIPLGGNRGGNGMLYRNLMITMILGGLWHGASMNFLLWGAYHGLILCIYKGVGDFMAKNRTDGRPTPSIPAHVLQLGFMFILTLLGWMLFRITDLTAMLELAVNMTMNWQLDAYAAYALKLTIFFSGPLMLYEWILHRHKDDHLLLLRKHWGFRLLLYGYFLGMMVLFSQEGRHDFIYFQF